MINPIADCEHPLLFLLGPGIASQEIAISGSCQLNLAGICKSVWVWWLYIGYSTKLENLDEMDKFLDRYQVPKLNQDQINDLNCLL